MLKKILSLFLIIIIVSCSSEKKEDETRKEVIVERSPYADFMFNLGYKLKQGSKHTYTLTTTTGQIQELIADTVITMSADQTEKYTIDSEILRVTSDGQNAVRVTVKQIEINGNMNGRTIEYNSKIPSQKNDKNFADYAILLNSPFRIIFGNDGEISNILDADKIVKNMTDRGGMTHEISQEEKKYLSEQLSMSVLQPMCQQIFRKLPDKMVAIDSAWSVISESGLATFKITNNAKYTLKDISIVQGDTLLSIHADLFATAEGQNTMKDEEASYYFHEPKVTGSGEITYNLTRGVFEKTDMTINIELMIEITSQNTLGQDIKVVRKDNTVNHYKVELL